MAEQAIDLNGTLHKLFDVAVGAGGPTVSDEEAIEIVIRLLTVIERTTLLDLQIRTSENSPRAHGSSLGALMHKPPDWLDGSARIIRADHLMPIPTQGQVDRWSNCPL